MGPQHLLLVFFIGLIAIGYVLMSMSLFSLGKENKLLKARIKEKENLELRRQGVTRMYGPNGLNNTPLCYNLRSWDAGKNWYVVSTYVDDKGVKIVGEAEKIYPGLIKQLENWDELIEYITKKGSPLDPGDAEDLIIMKKAGLTIEKKPVKPDDVKKMMI